MNVVTYIAKRYLWSKSDQKAINIITYVSAFGIIASAFSLVVVLSAFAGLKEFSLAFTNDYDPDLKLFPSQGKTIYLDEEKRSQLLRIDGINDASEIVEERVLLRFKDKNFPAFIKGVDAQFRSVNAIESSVFIGSWFDNPYQVVLGNGIARGLGVGVYDATGILTFLVPKPGKGQVTWQNAFRTSNATASGIYVINEDLDAQFVYSDISFARDLLNIPEDEVTHIELRLAPNANLKEVAKALDNLFEGDVITRDRIQLNDSLYKMLNTEYLAVYFIFTLVIIVALFNVVGSLIMSILDKKHNLKTLSNLGATLPQLKQIFFLKGAMMSVFGGLLGIVLGSILVWTQYYFEWFMITPSLAYPVALEWSNLLIVLATISILGLLASWIASSRLKVVL